MVFELSNTWVTAICKLYLHVYLNQSMHPSVFPFSEPFIIFSGGMPRASYGDRHTVSVMQGNAQAHVVFEFTSRVVDFVTLCTSDETENLEKMGRLI